MEERAVRAERGFTLIELLIILSILGILLGVVAMSISDLDQGQEGALQIIGAVICWQAPQASTAGPFAWMMESGGAALWRPC
jgi:prepilin-type N-terminal cleavage/methylation domain-containing protein